MTLDSFIRYPLMFAPSPIHQLDRSSEYLKGATHWANREILDDVIIVDRFHAGTYAIPDHRTFNTMRLGATLEEKITNPVNEGQSLAGLIHKVQDREIEPDANILFAHHGGQSALNAYFSLFT